MWREAVLSADVRSSDSYPLDTEWHNFLQELDVGLCVECGEMNGDITSPSLVTTPNTMQRIECLIFINIDKSCGDRAIRLFFCEFTIWSWQIFFSFEKKQNMFSRRGCLCLLKRFTAKSYFFPSRPKMKIVPFSPFRRNYLRALLAR